MSAFLVLFVTVSICCVFLVILSIVCKHKYWAGPEGGGQKAGGLMSNPQLSGALKSSLLGQVELSVGAAGLVRLDQSEPCLQCQLVQSGQSISIGGLTCQTCGMVQAG